MRAAPIPADSAPATYTVMPSPIGDLLLTARDGVLTRLDMAPPSGTHAAPAGAVEDAASLDKVRIQLEEYFAGERTDFDIEMHLEGTPFQQRVWAELCTIPYGQVISYGDLARRVGNPGAARAVGSANGRNPVAVIVPCHRVIASGGGLGGYGGGLDRKTYLLDLEQRVLAHSA